MSEAFEKWKAAGMIGAWLMVSDADAKVIWEAAYTAGLLRAVEIVDFKYQFKEDYRDQLICEIAAAIRKEAGDESIH